MKAADDKKSSFGSSFFMQIFLPFHCPYPKNVKKYMGIINIFMFFRPHISDNTDNNMIGFRQKDI